jgi:phosphoribosylamine-glycine ligase
MKKTIEEKASKMVGDGKTPNRYWVSVSNDYNYVHKEDDGVSYIDYIGDIIEDWQKDYSKGKMIGMFNSEKEAFECADSFFIGEKFEDFTINRITIEDRLQGQVRETVLILDVETGKTFVDTW